MEKTLLVLFIFITFFIGESNVFAEKDYYLTGMARIANTTSKPDPVRIVEDWPFSPDLSLENNHFTLIANNGGEVSCNAMIISKHPFSSEDTPFMTRESLDEFLGRKFHTSSKNWKTTYLLGKSNSEPCEFSSAHVYQSDSEFFLVIENFIYEFSSGKSSSSLDNINNFDCADVAPKTFVEHLVCNNPELKKMDASMDDKFTIAEGIDTKEISYENPVIIKQIKWLANVRNKCTTEDCLSKAYSERIKHFDKKLSKACPGYPNDNCWLPD